MELIDKILSDALPCETLDWIEVFSKLYDEQDIYFGEFTFDSVNLDDHREVWWNLMLCYIQGIQENLDLNLIDIDSINIDYVDGISYFVDSEDEDLIEELEKFNSSQPIQIEIIKD